MSSFNQDPLVKSNICEISRFEVSAEKKLWNQNQNVHKCQVKILDLNATNWRIFSQDPSVEFKSCEICTFKSLSEKKLKLKTKIFISAGQSEI